MRVRANHFLFTVLVVAPLVLVGGILLDVRNVEQNSPANNSQTSSHWTLRSDDDLQSNSDGETFTRLTERQPLGNQLEVSLEASQAQVRFSAELKDEAILEFDIPEGFSFAQVFDARLEPELISVRPQAGSGGRGVGAVFLTLPTRLRNMEIKVQTAQVDGSLPMTLDNFRGNVRLTMSAENSQADEE